MKDNIATETLTPRDDDVVPNLKAFLDVPYALYMTMTLLLYSFIVFCACVIPSVDVVFGFMSAISISSISFTLPGLFYLLTYRRYCVQGSQSFRECMSWVYIITGLFLLVFLFVGQIIQLVVNGESGAA